MATDIMMDSGGIVSDIHSPILNPVSPIDSRTQVKIPEIYYTNEEEINKHLNLNSIQSPDKRRKSEIRRKSKTFVAYSKDRSDTDHGNLKAIEEI